MSDQRPADRYHHGDLRNALVGAATALAREGGPDAVVLREAARRAGVSAAAAYHHFASREDLVQAVKQRSLDLLTGEMRAAMAQETDTRAAVARPTDTSLAVARETAPVGNPASRADSARRRLRALGVAYLRFATAEPGLFRLTFGPRGRWPVAGTHGPHHTTTDPFRLLAQVLDELADAGAVPAERRPGLEYVVWAAVHGTAVLCLDGPLASADPAQRQQIIEHALDTIIRGL
jgi:AcrR family transcriptional regulator